MRIIKWFIIELKLWLRNGVNIFWNILFPSLWFLFMTIIFVNDYNRSDALAYYIPSGIMLALLSSLISISMRISISKELKILKRFGLLPVSVFSYFLVQIFCMLAIVLFSIFLLLVGASFVGFRPDSGITLLLILLFSVLGSLVFAAIGFFIAGISHRITTTNAASTITMFVMMFLSDLFIPNSSKPDFLIYIASALPVSPLLVILRSLFMHKFDFVANIGNVCLVLGWGITALILSLVTFKIKDTN